jgi:hypothetical protein
VSMLPIVDAIRANVPAPDQCVRDDAGTEPIEYVADRLYAWAETEERLEEGSGRMDMGNFSIGLAVTLRSGEQAAGVADRAVSEALDDAVDALSTWVRDHRTNADPLWEDLQVTAVQYGGLRGFEYRGHRVRLGGYRLITS